MSRICFLWYIRSKATLLTVDSGRISSILLLCVLCCELGAVGSYIFNLPLRSRRPDPERLSLVRPQGRRKIDLVYLWTAKRGRYWTLASGYAAHVAKGRCGQPSIA